MVSFFLGGGVDGVSLGGAKHDMVSVCVCVRVFFYFFYGVRG